MDGSGKNSSKKFASAANFKEIAAPNAKNRMKQAYCATDYNHIGLFAIARMSGNAGDQAIAGELYESR